MQQQDDPPSLPVGTEVSAKYKGAFCEAKVSKVVRNIKVKVVYKQGLGTGIVPDDAIKAPPGQMRVGAVVEVRHPDRKEIVEATIAKIQDGSQYTVVFDDGDITTLRRTALCLKSGRHFNESETLDQLPLTHPEHFGNPVVGGRRGRRRGQLNEDSSDDDDESDAKEVVNEKEENIGQVVCVETESKKKDKEKWFPALVVAPTAQATVRIRVKDEYLVRSFKDGRYYTVPKKEATEFTREVASKQDVPAVQAALEFLDSSILPPHWDRDSLFGLSNLTSDDDGEIDSDSSDDEPHEEKDRFVAQLYKYMDDRGTPLNKVPSIQSRDVDLYRLFRAVQKRGGYNRVTTQNQWKMIAVRLGFAPCTVSVMNLVKQAYKKFLQPYGDFHRKLGCSMLMTSRNTNRSKGRSLVRANSVASPKPMETTKTETISKLAQPNQTAHSTSSTSSANAAAAAAAAASSAATSSSSIGPTLSAAASAARAASTASISTAEESENTSESSVVVEPIKKQRKASAAASTQQQGKVKSLVEKYEEKSSPATPLAASAAPTAATAATPGAAIETMQSTITAATTSAASHTPSTATPASAATTSAAATATATPSAAVGKDTESDMPLAKIKLQAAAAAAAAVTRNSMEKDQQQTNISPGSATSSKANSADNQRSRDASPASAAAGPSAAPPTTVKKEKHQRKQVEKTDEKQRGKRKKEDKDISVEKIDTGDFVVGIGDKLKVNYHEKKSPSSHGSTYEAKVIEISVQRGVPMYLVHYTGWNNRYDEWVPRERIAENLTKGSKQKTRTISTSSANSGSGGGGGGGGGAGSGTLPPGPGGGAGGDKQPQPGKDGPSKTVPPSGAPGGQQIGQSGNPSGFSMASSLIQGMVKTPTTTGAKRGRGRSDSMPPRSTTPSSVASNSSRTKSPASSQQQLQQQQPMKKRPTRGPTNSANIHRISDASLASESDSDSDEPVRRPKRQSAKEKAAGKPQATAKGRLSRAPSSGPTAAAAQQSPTDDSDEDEEEEEEEGPGHTPSKQQQQQQQQAPPSLQRSRAAGNRAMSSGAATSKGRDYDLSEIRSELKGFQPQLLSSSAASSSALPSAERKNHSKGEGHAPVGDIKKEPKMESSAKSSSTELSSETDSYVDEDSQSSDYRKQASEKRTKAGAAGQTAGKAGNEPTGSGDSMQLLESIKTEAKDMIKAKPFHTGADIKPTTTLIAPARFGLSSSSSQSAAASSSSSTSTQGPCLSAVAVAKYTSVIVEKPLTMTTAAGASSKKDPPHASKKVDSLKKQSNTAGGGATATATSGQEAKKFAEPVSTLKVELPAACSPSSSSSSSSSFCSSASGGSSSSATRSLPDMSKLAISGGAGTGATAAAAAGPSGTQPSTPPTAASTASKESKYSSSCLAAATGGPLTLGDLLASDVYEFKDTEPFEFEKRISPMAATCSTTATGVAGVAGLPAAASTVITAVPSQPVPAAGAAAAAAGGAGAAAAGGGGTSPTAGTPLVLVSSAARKQALKATAMQHSLEQHQLPSTVHGAAAGAAAAGAGAGAGAAPPTVALAAGKAKKRGSPLKEASLVLEKPKLIKLEKEQTEQKPTMPQQHQQQQQQQQTPPTVKVVAATPNLAQKLNTPPGVGAAGAGSSSASANVGQLTPGHHATPFDALRKSPSFNLNIMALNEELAQTVQETTRALTDALQPPTTPISASVPAAGPLLICPVTPPTGAGSQAAASPKLSTPPQPQTKPPPPANVVGSPFIETRNVFELSTSNEGSGYSSGESKDNKLEKLENVKILLAGAAGLPFDLDAVKYEQKTSSIADKVLKAISQKKEEVENNKSKPQPLPLPQPHTEATGTGTGTTTGVDGSTPLLLAKPEPCTSSKLEALKMLSEPLKIQTGSLLGELYRPGPATNSPETKSILDSMPAKNNELSETIQKLECAIQQRKTPVGGLSLASSTAGTPPTAHTPNSTVTVGVGGGFSDESMDSTDSEQRLVIEDVIVEDHTTTTTAEQKSPGSQEELAETMDRTISTPTPPVKLELMGSKQLSSSGIQAPIALKLAQAQAETSTGPGCSSFAGKLAAVTQPPPLAKLQQQQQQQHQPPEESKMGSSFGIPIVLPEIPATVVMATPSIMIPAFTIPMEQDQDSPPIMACTSSPASPSPPTVSPELGDRLGSGLLLKTYIEPEAETRSSYHQQQQQQQQLSTAAQTEIVLQSNVNVSSSSGWMGRGAEIAGDTAPVVARPFVMHAVNKEMYNVVANTAAPAASSPLINDPHNESINLLCEETIPGSPAPTYGGKDEQMPATGSSALVIAGITPLSPDTPPPGAIGLLQGTTGAQQNVGESAMGASPANSSPDSASQEDESSEETKTKHLENELEGLGLGGTLRKRKRTSKQTQAQISAVAAQLQSLSKRRRQVSGMRSSKTTATVTAGSDTDENSDHLVSNLGQQPAQQQQQLRHSGRQQLLPLSNTQQQQQQQQPQQQQQQQPQLSQQLQQPMQQQTQQSSSSTQLGVRPCPYNFLVELDRSLSSDQCITILRKQIQDLRKAYNTIKGELAAIDRRRKKMRRREREKKQQQQQGQTQGKVCT